MGAMFACVARSPTKVSAIHLRSNVSILNMIDFERKGISPAFNYLQTA